ncbi:MAG: hypothetical protein CM1200mP39_16580 [Dehalococcoidia bacterium]|nr:MAG: hypothetical protein CM1200mP39_16580 [Dehalococcoidia bacterium]
MAIIGLVINGVLGGVIVLIWGERRLFGRFQSRTGPNRWGPFGMLTSVADAIKTMFKGRVVPVDADGILFNLAPFDCYSCAFSFAYSIWIGTYVADLNVVFVHNGCYVVDHPFCSYAALGLSQSNSYSFSPTFGRIVIS